MSPGGCCKIICYAQSDDLDPQKKVDNIIGVLKGIPGEVNLNL